MAKKLLGVLALFLAAASARAADRPNLVLILIDDLGYGDIGPFDSKLNHTPNLDRMAKEGMKLTSFYGCPVAFAVRCMSLEYGMPK